MGVLELQRVEAEGWWKRELDRVNVELEEERAISRQVQEDLEGTRRVAEKVESTAREAVQKANEVRKNQEREWEERLAQAEFLCKEEEQKVKDLEMELWQAPASSKHLAPTRRHTLMDRSPERHRPALARSGTW